MLYNDSYLNDILHLYPRRNPLNTVVYKTFCKVKLLKIFNEN